jgi:hypothetical protein
MSLLAPERPVSEPPAPEYTESGYRVLAAELQPAPRRSFRQRVLGALVATGAFLAKFGAVLYKLKIFTVAGSMIVSIGAYALLGGWWFGVGLVGLIFIHEMARRAAPPGCRPRRLHSVHGVVIGMGSYRPTPGGRRKSHSQGPCSGASAPPPSGGPASIPTPTS